MHEKGYFDKTQDFDIEFNDKKHDIENKNELIMIDLGSSLKIEKANKAIPYQVATRYYRSQNQSWDYILMKKLIFFLLDVSCTN